MAPTPVHSFWDGTTSLGRMEQLTIRSFQDHGHPFVLWTYQLRLQGVPEGALIRDAREILPESAIYRLQGGSHPGSLALFADRFQLEALYRHGGWWVHMDALCLKSFDSLAEAYVFAPHWAVDVSCYVMKAPAGSLALKYMIDRHRNEVVPDDYDWHVSMRIISAGVEEFALDNFVVGPEIFPDDSHWNDAGYFASTEQRPPETVFAFHWCHAANARFAEASPVEGSFFAESLQKHGLLP